MEREIGYYWVRILAIWQVAYWNKEKCWTLVGDEREYKDVHFIEINEKKLER